MTHPPETESHDGHEREMRERLKEQTRLFFYKSR